MSCKSNSPAIPQIQRSQVAVGYGSEWMANTQSSHDPCYNTVIAACMAKAEVLQRSTGSQGQRDVAAPLWTGHHTGNRENSGHVSQAACFL
eukprot:1161728-Pelagomonas_calceolata.AAC.4